MPGTRRCAYCGKERPNEEMKRGTITIRGRKRDYRRGKDVACIENQTNWYCGDSSCQGDDQMAQEG